MKRLIVLSGIAVFGFLSSCQKAEELPSVNQQVTEKIDVVADEMDGTSDKVVSLSLSAVRKKLYAGTGSWRNISSSFKSYGQFRSNGTYKSYHKDQKWWGKPLVTPSTISGSWSLQSGNIIQPVFVNSQKWYSLAGKAIKVVTGGHNKRCVILNVGNRRWVITKLTSSRLSLLETSNLKRAVSLKKVY